MSQNGIAGMEVKNYGTVGNSPVGVGLVYLGQFNQILRKHHEQNLSREMAATLLRIALGEVSRMPLNNDQESDLRGQSRQQPDSEGDADETIPTDSSRPVIELGDLTTGAEAEVNRLKTNMIALSGEISQIRVEHVGLASDYQKLTGELREIKLVLAKVHAKELRGIEWRSSWMESLRLLRELFQKGPNHRKSQGAKNRVSSLRK